MTKLRKLSVEEMKDISGGVIIVEIKKPYGTTYYEVWSDDMNYRYFSFCTKEAAEKFASKLFN